MVYYTTSNNFGTAKWIVDPTAGQGTHTTIATALTSSSSGDTIFVRPGTYTENLTLKAGVNIVAFVQDSITPNVTIIGKASFSSAGTATISNIKLQTNSDFVVSITGTVASIVKLSGCYINCSNNTGLSCTSTSASALIRLDNCNGNIGTTGISLFAVSAGGTIQFFNSTITNTGSSTTASTQSDGSVALVSTEIDVPITTSNAASLTLREATIITASTNTTSLTVNGTGSTDVRNSEFQSGTASCISIGAGATLIIYNCNISSSNTNVVTGSGTYQYNTITYTGSSSGVNASTKSAMITGPNIYTSGLTFDNGTNVLSSFVLATTFTPVLNFGGGTTGITYSQQYGKYQRVGNCVTFIIAVTLTNKGSSAGNATITGLPITSANDGGGHSWPMNVLSITAATATYFFASLGANTTTITPFFAVATTGAFTQLADTNFQNGTAFYVIGSYFV